MTTFGRRGELRSYTRRSYTRRSSPDVRRTVLLVSSDGIDDSPRPWLLGIELREPDPGDLVAIPVHGHGWAYASDVSRIYRARIGEREATLDGMTLSRIDEAVRVALGL